MLSLALVGLAWAVPMELDHQGRLLDASGDPLTGQHAVRVALYPGQTGAAFWSSTQTLEVEAGYFHVTLDGLQTDDFAGGDVWIGLTVDQAAELPRRPLASVPFAFLADTSTNVSGGVVDATEIRVDGTTVIDGAGVVHATELQINGTTVIDGTGAISGGGTLTDLGCGPDQVPRFDGSDWQCATFDEAAVELMVENGPLDLAGGTTLDGAAISTGPHTTTLPWSAISSKPAHLGGLSCAADEVARYDGAAWRCVAYSEAAVEAMIVDDPLALATGSTVGGAAISTGAHTSTLPWSAITGTPATIGELSCDPGQLAAFDGNDWSCADAVPAPVSCDPWENLYWTGASWACQLAVQTEGDLFVAAHSATATTSTAGTGTGGNTGAVGLTTAAGGSGTSGSTSGTTGAAGAATTSSTDLVTGATSLTTSSGGGHGHVMGASRQYGGYYGYCNGNPARVDDCTTAVDGWTEIRTDSAMVTYLQVQSVGGHTHTIGAHNHAIAGHTHTIGDHTHTVSAHSHALPDHTHTIAAHSHPGFAHSHTVTVTEPSRGWVAFATPLPYDPASVTFEDPRTLAGAASTMPTGLTTTYVNRYGFAWAATAAADALVHWEVHAQ